MPAGCEFSCDNEECKCYNTGFVMTGAWPLGDINLVIESDKTKKVEGFKGELEELRDQGKKHACISYPNTNNIPKIGYRIQKWCNKCNCMWTWDVISEKEEETVEEAIAREGVITKCPKCHGMLLDFDIVLEDGIICPHCKDDMKTSRWFICETNED